MFLVSASEQTMGHSRYFFLYFILFDFSRFNVDLKFKRFIFLFFGLKMAMQGFTQKIVQMMKNERLFASQGGPIILSQVNRLLI